jgi:SNF2 family DNA or RNA helicase
VVGNWEREVHRFAPSLDVRRHHGQDRQLGEVGDGDVVLTTYGVARHDAGELAEINWGLVIADEAQAIKNPHSRTARALRRISAGARFALTGTPVQNHLIDLWAILDWTTPGLLGSLERFRRDLAAPVERGDDPEAASQLGRLLRPFVLRRTKADPRILPDLPPKTETDEIVPLTTEQAALYQAVVTEVMAEIASAEGIERKGLVLRLITRLKQVCNHPEHLLADGGPLGGRSGKLDATMGLLETIVGEGQRALLFTQYVAMGDLLVDHLAANGMTTHFLHGGLSLPRRQQMVDEFQAGDVDVFILSLRAGGTGLNLTKATHVIHYDRWWNPAVEDQASDRAWRIGQDQPVQIHRMICEGTIEDRIASLLNDKRLLADAVIGAGEGWISDLSDADLADLVALSDVDRADVDTDTDDDGPRPATPFADEPAGGVR